MTSKKSLALIFGGRSGEHEVSLMSARSVRSVLSHDKYDVIEIGISRDGIMVHRVQMSLRLLKTINSKNLTPIVLLPEPHTQTLYLRKGDKLESLPPVDVFFPVTHGTFGEDGTLQGTIGTCRRCLCWLRCFGFCRWHGQMPLQRCHARQ